MKELELKAKRLRKEVLAKALEKGEAHLGGSLSEIELMVSLYDKILKKEDKFILSKGHACYPLYVLLQEQGYNPAYACHPNMDISNGICCTTGSLGHGLPMGIGMALARKKLNKEGKIYVLMGDGECQEGTTWESALIAAHHKLDNLYAIIDRNSLQALNSTEDVLALGNLEEKFRTFNWNAKTIDGHNFEQILSSLKDYSKDKPNIIIANTIKGKGISYMENDPKWHTRFPNAEELKIAYEELK